VRILVDARCLAEPFPSGVGQYAAELMRALFAIDQANAYVLLTTGWKRPALPFPLPKNATHVHARVPNKLLNASVVYAGRPSLPELAGGRFDLCFLPNLDIVSLPKDLPYVLTVHDASWKLFPELYSLKRRLWHAATRPNELIRNAAAVITPSLATKRDVVRLFQKPADTVHPIPHGVSPAFSPGRKPDDHGWKSKLHLPKRYALFVGTIEPRKQVDVLVKAVAAYRETSGDDLALVIAGGWGWHTDDVRTLIRQHPWARSIGYVPDDARPALYRGAECLVWPSAYEGFGMPVLEAMACATPVITSYISAMPEVAGNAAILLNPHDFSDVALALGQLLGSEGLRAAMQKAGRARAGTFSWEATARRTLDLFSSVLRK
jgi:glycosyltransferase involved in cell wall biosynthesis